MPRNLGMYFEILFAESSRRWRCHKDLMACSYLATSDDRGVLPRIPDKHIAHSDLNGARLRGAASDSRLLASKRKEKLGFETSPKSPANNLPEKTRPTQPRDKQIRWRDGCTLCRRPIVGSARTMSFGWPDQRCRPGLCSERDARRKHPTMIVGVELGRRDLHTHCGRQPKSSCEVRAPKSKSGGQEHLHLARIFSRGVKRGVRFQFGPEFPRRPILERRVPHHLSAQLGRVPCRQIDAQGRLHVKSSPAFAERHCRRDHCFACPVAMRTRRRSRRQ